MNSKTFDSIVFAKLKVFLAVVFFIFLVSGCKSTRSVPEPIPATTDSGLQVLLTSRGGKIFPEQGDIVKVHYTGKLEDGTIFDSSFERGEPINFRMGKGQVIKGLEEGISLLSQGSTATLVIPPDLAYGSEGFGPVPADATLIFEVELLEVTKAGIDSELAEESKVSFKSGLEYTILKQGSGKPLEPGMKVSVHYTGYLEDETIFDSSWDRQKPISFILGKGMVIQGWEQGLLQLNVGDKARLYIPDDLAYGSAGRGPIPPDANLIFDIEVLEAHKIETPEPFRVSDRDTLSLESGLQYILVEQGNGIFPQPGQVILVHYTGYLPDGTMFDSSVQRGEPFRFVLGKGQVISGWDQAFPLLSKGAKARLIIPPHLAYGHRDMGIIPPGSTLIFDVEVLDF